LFPLESRQLEKKNDVNPAFMTFIGVSNLGCCIIPHSIAAFSQPSDDPFGSGFLMTFVWPFKPDTQKDVMFMHKQTRRVIDLFLATTWGMFVDTSITVEHSNHVEFPVNSPKMRLAVSLQHPGNSSTGCLESRHNSSLRVELTKPPLSIIRPGRRRVYHC
jgi:hypothetical protein